VELRERRFDDPSRIVIDLRETARAAETPGERPPEGAFTSPTAESQAPPENLHYVIQRGDELEIRAFKIPELDEQVLVRADGRISAPLLDDVMAAGLTTEELANQLARGYSKKSFREPEITVIVRKFATYSVYVGGEVDAPGLVPLRNRMTSLKAVFRAGGFLDTAQMTNLIVLRDAGGHPELIKLDAKKILSGDEPDMKLRPFDVVFVPKSKIAQVNLFVEQYIKRVIPISLSGVVQFSYLSGAN
jgi:protein involved in polysaccharide export with SLBB domain